MKKNIFAIAFVAIALCLGSCQKEEVTPLMETVRIL